MFSSFTVSDSDIYVNDFLQLIAAITAPLVTLMATSILSKYTISPGKEIALVVFSIAYMLLLSRAVLEVVLHEEFLKFEFWQQLGNGMVLPIVHLLSPTLLLSNTKRS